MDPSTALTRAMQYVLNDHIIKVECCHHPFYSAQVQKLNVDSITDLLPQSNTESFLVPRGTFQIAEYKFGLSSSCVLRLKCHPRTGTFQTPDRTYNLAEYTPIYRLAVTEQNIDAVLYLLSAKSVVFDIGSYRAIPVPDNEGFYTVSPPGGLVKAVKCSP